MPLIRARKLIHGYRIISILNPIDISQTKREYAVIIPSRLAASFRTYIHLRSRRCRVGFEALQNKKKTEKFYRDSLLFIRNSYFDDYLILFVNSLVNNKYERKSINALVLSSFKIR